MITDHRQYNTTPRDYINIIIPASLPTVTFCNLANAKHCHLKRKENNLNTVFGSAKPMQLMLLIS